MAPDIPELDQFETNLRIQKKQATPINDACISRLPEILMVFILI